MKLLLDENLSARVLPEILDLYPFSSHVGILGLSQNPDSVIWEQARTGSFCIVSKDSDFQQRSLLFGAPPKVIFLRMGNCSTLKIISALRVGHNVIRGFWADPDASLLILS